MIISHERKIGIVLSTKMEKILNVVIKDQEMIFF